MNCIFQLCHILCNMKIIYAILCTDKCYPVFGNFENY